MVSEIHKDAARMIWAGSYSSIEIVDTLAAKYDILGDAAERELYIRVGKLRDQIKEARDLAPATAKKMLEDGYERKEIEDALKAPYLLSGFEVDGIVSRALAACKAEQE